MVVGWLVSSATRGSVDPSSRSVWFGLFRTVKLRLRVSEQGIMVGENPVPVDGFDMACFQISAKHARQAKQNPEIRRVTCICKAREGP
jgi:hypothetical protein